MKKASLSLAVAVMIFGGMYGGFQAHAASTGALPAPVSVPAEDKTLNDLLYEDLYRLDHIPVQAEDRGRMREGRPMRGEGMKHPTADHSEGRGQGQRKERREQLRERIEQMPPERREKAMQRMDEMKEKRQAIKQELESLPPEERKARMEELRQQFEENREGRREEFRQKLEDRWNSASDQERTEFCANALERCAADGMRACDFAEKNCASD